MNNRLAKVKKLKRLIGALRHRHVVFTDEKVFTLEQMLNVQNDRILLPKNSKERPEAAFVTRQKFTASVMVWGGVTANGKTPLVFVEKGAKIDAKFYQERILRDVLKPWADSHFGEAQWTLQQDWTPSHRAKSTKALCRQLFPAFWDEDVCPSNSPDLNPLEYAIWGIMERKVCATRHANLDSLKASILKAWNEITENQLCEIVDDFPRRLKAQ